MVNITLADKRPVKYACNHEKQSYADRPFLHFGIRSNEKNKEKKKEIFI